MEKQSQLNELNIRNLISGVFRKKHIIFIVVPVIILATFFFLLLQTRIYEATVKMHIVGKAQIRTEFYYDLGTRGIHQTQMEIVRSNPVLKRAVIALKLDKRPFDYEKKFSHPVKKILIDYKTKKLNDKIKKITPEELREFYINYAIESLKDNLNTTAISSTDLFEISVTDFNQENALAIANVVSRSYIIFDLQQQLAELTQRYGLRHPSIQQLRDNIFSMTEKLSGDPLSEFEAYGTASVKIIEQALPSSPKTRPKFQIFLLAIVMSFAAGIGLAIAFDIFLDQTFKSPTEIVKFTGLPLLGSIPIMKNKDNILIDIEKFNPTKSEKIYSDFFEDLSDQLLIYMKVNKQKVILITSAFPKGGSSTICVNIGLCLSQKMAVKTLVIDANFRHPVLHKLFKVNETAGLANMLEEGRLIEYHSVLRPENENIEQQQVIIADKMDNPKEKNPKKQMKIKTSEILHHINNKLDFLQAGKASMTPLALLNDTKIDAFFKLVKNDYDAVIIDSTNLKEYKDTGVLSAHVDGIALIVNDGKERRQLVQNSISYIKQKKGNLIGLILNRRRFPIPEILYKWI